MFSNGRNHTRAIMCIKSLIMVAKMIVMLTQLKFKKKQPVHGELNDNPLFRLETY